MLLVELLDKKTLNPNSKNPYVVFTPFLKHVKKYKVLKPKKKIKKLNNKKLNCIYSITNDKIKSYYQENKDKHVIASEKSIRYIK